MWAFPCAQGEGITCLKTNRGGVPFEGDSSIAILRGMLSCAEVGRAFSDVIAAFFEGDHGDGLVAAIIFFADDSVVSHFVGGELCIHVKGCFSSFDFFNGCFGIEGVRIVNGESLHGDLRGIHHEDRLHETMEDESCAIRLNFYVVKINERKSYGVDFRLIMVGNMVAHIESSSRVEMIGACRNMDGTAWVPACFADHFSESRTLIFLYIGLDSEVLAANQLGGFSRS